MDRAALDVAIQMDISHGGFCPLGRRAEDGGIPARYLLVETDSEHYHVRTEANVRTSDGTLILYRHRLSGGTKLTYKLTRRHHKPCLRVDLTQHPRESDVRQWLREQRIDVLNVAGPRESQAPGIYVEATAFLQRVFGPAVVV